MFLRRMKELKMTAFSPEIDNSQGWRQGTGHRDRGKRVAFFHY